MNDAGLEAAKRLAEAAKNAGLVHEHKIVTPADKVNFTFRFGPGIQRAVEYQGVVYHSTQEFRRKFGCHHNTLKKLIESGKARYADL